MAMAVTMVGQSRADQIGLACSAINVQIGDISLELPAHSANNSDYDHAAEAGISLDAGVFNYYHRNSAGYSIEHKTTQDNIASKISQKQKAHSPALTILSLEHYKDLDASGLEALHGLQVRLGLPILTTVEKNPMQDLDGLREELEAFDRLDTDQERFPTISVRCDPDSFEEKLLHIVRNYDGFNLQWGGYAGHSASWSILSKVLRDHNVWCNVVGILNRGVNVATPTGEKIRTTGITRPLLYGGHSYCFAWPHTHPQAEAGGGARRQPKQRVELFSPATWRYEPSRLGYPAARTRSFNAIQGALGAAREEIAVGTFYSSLCSRMPGMRGALRQIQGTP